MFGLLLRGDGLDVYIEAFLLVFVFGGTFVLRLRCSWVVVGFDLIVWFVLFGFRVWNLEGCLLRLCWAFVVGFRGLMVW